MRPDLNHKQLLILDKGGNKNPLYYSWTSLLTFPHAYVEDYDIGWTPPPSCALLVTAQHYQEPELDILHRTLKSRVPILIIADGIVEYRNTWEHPDIPPGSIFQPVIGHKIACLGRSQARILESWGNLGKCEVVGAPRFDSLLHRSPRKRKPNEPFRILVMTARTAGFTTGQLDLAKRSLQDLKFWFSQHERVNETPIEPVWRLTQDLDKVIGVENARTPISSYDLAEILGNVDAVLTSPSTGMLEGMLHRLPVALLDYNNCPHYVPAAWAITAPRHIEWVVPELLEPPAAKMLYQDTMLHDALECRTPAGPRMVRLVEEMLRLAHGDRQGNQTIAFPRRIITDDQDGHHLPEENFDMQALYPAHPIFSEMDRTRLQVEVEQLRNQVKLLRNVIKVDNILREVSKSFPGPRKLLRLWRESRSPAVK